MTPLLVQKNPEFLATVIGVLFGWFGRQIEGPGLPGASIIYHGYPFSRTRAGTCNRWYV